MTAVAPPPNLQSINRPGWGAPGPNGHAANNGLNAMNADDVSRMLLPRKTAQRTNSSSSINSLASSTSTSSTSSASTVVSASSTPQTNGGDWGSRKRTTRGIWQPSKSEPIAGISTARPQSVNSATSGPSAASAISALHNPNNMSHQNGQPETQQNGAVALGKVRQNENPAVLYLTPMNGTFERKTINVPFFPDVLRIGRQTNNKTMPTATNGYFDSKVLSRQHAEIWSDRVGKIWIRDVKSSNGTFVNGQRLSLENKDSEPHELREQDMLELGIDIVSEDQKTVVHHKVAARVEHAGFYGPGSVLDLNFGDLDNSTNSGGMGNNLGQNLGQMRRTGSQTSLNSNGRMSVGSAATNTSNVQQRAPHFWLAPVNMDKIIQKLNAECKAARQQSLDLQRAQQHIDSIMAAEKQPAKKEISEKISPIEKAKGKDSFKARFSEPPAPPPRVPLPDAPPFSPLNRSDTERPRSLSKSFSSTTEAVANAAQFATLMEQLTKARQEVETERGRLRETEDLLVQERVKREDAEQRAKRLESAVSETQLHQVTPSPEQSDGTHTPIEDDEQQDMPDPKKLQDRFDLLLAEFNEYKVLASVWQAEKEQAEKERDEERKERKTLAEMIEQLRAEEATRVEKEAKRKARRRRSRSKSSGETIRPDGVEDSASDDEVEGVKSTSNGTHEQKKTLQNGHPVVNHKHPKGSSQSDTALAQRGLPITDAAPYISMISIVMIGVAVMSLMNRMQRGEAAAG